MSEAVSALPAVTTLAAGDLLTAVKVLDTTTAPAGAGGSNKKITAQNLANIMAILAGNVTTIQPSSDTSGAADTAAINAVISAGGVAVLAWTGTGTPFWINAPLTPATGSCLLGMQPWTSSPGDQYGKGAGFSGGTVIKAVAAFSGSGAIAMNNTTGTQWSGISLLNCTIDMSSVSTSGHGIFVHGAVGASIIDGVCVNYPATDALHFEADVTNSVGPDNWWVSKSKFSGASAYGVFADNLPDSTFDAVESSDSELDNWNIGFSLNTKFLACKGENSGAGGGFHFTGQGSAQCSVSLVNCGTHLNNKDGYLFDGGAGGSGGVYTLVGCYADNDGQAGGTTYAGFRAAGSPDKVNAVGCKAFGAAYGASQTGSSTGGMLFTGSSLTGTTAALHDDGTNTFALTSHAPSGTQRALIRTAFTQASSTSAQNVTGLAATLPVGTYKITVWAPMKQSAGTGTEKFGFTFGGTVTSLWGKWLVTQGTTQTNTLITTITTQTASTAALSSGALLFAEFSGQIVVSAAGTLQFQVQASATGNQVIFPVGAYIDVEPLI